MNWSNLHRLIQPWRARFFFSRHRDRHWRLHSRFFASKRWTDRYHHKRWILHGRIKRSSRRHVDTKGGFCAVSRPMTSRHSVFHFRASTFVRSIAPNPRGKMRSPALSPMARINSFALWMRFAHHFHEFREISSLWIRRLISRQKQVERLVIFNS